MKKYKKARKLAALLASVLVIDSCIGFTAPHLESFAYTERTATVNASSLNVRSGPGTTYSVVAKLANGASVTVIDEKTASDGALWYQIRFTGSNGANVTGYASRAFIKFPVSYTSDADFESHLTSEGFPESYKVKLRSLHAQYPKWVFRAQQTNLDWNTAVKEESQVGRTLVAKSSKSSWKSIADGAFNWDTSAWTGFDGSSWVSASEDIVRYYMDPRNFLDENNVFQFLSHSYDSNSHTVEGLKTMVKGSFLEGTASGSSGSSSGTAGGDSSGSGPGVSGVGPGGSSAPASGDSSAPTSGSAPSVSLEGPHASITPKNTSVLMEYGPGMGMSGPSADNGSGSAPSSGSSSYVDIIMNAGTQSGVNPYVLAAMIIVEQGSNGKGGSISGTESSYSGIYNFFNIEAYQSGGMGAVERGLWWASQSGSYNRPWNSPEASILGGSIYYGNNYVKVGQDTFYLKKFNVQGTNLYKHQYMTNVQGAASEALFYAKAYNSEMKQTALEFKIPIFNNMTDSPASQPTVDGSPNNKLANLSVEGFVITPTYNRDTLDYNLIVDPSVSSVNIQASALDSTASISGSGTIQLQSGSNDVKIQATAQNGSVRTYTVHVVRQENGPTYSSSVGGSSGGSSGGPGASGGPGVSGGPGASSQDSNASSGSTSSGAGTPGGSNVTIAPDGSTGR